MEFTVVLSANSAKTDFHYRWEGKPEGLKKAMENAKKANAKYERELAAAAVREQRAEARDQRAADLSRKRQRDAMEREFDAFYGEEMSKLSEILEQWNEQERVAKRPYSWREFLNKEGATTIRDLLASESEEEEEL